MQYVGHAFKTTVFCVYSSVNVYVEIVYGTHIVILMFCYLEVEVDSCQDIQIIKIKRLGGWLVFETIPV